MPHHIILVDPNRADVLIFREIFTEVVPDCAITSFSSHQEALEHFQALAKGEGEKPYMLVMDIDRSQENQTELLDFIKESDSLRHIPVVVLSGSLNFRDILRCYRSYANGYILKPEGIDQYRKITRALRDYWFQTVTHPSQT